MAMFARLTTGLKVLASKLGRWNSSKAIAKPIAKVRNPLAMERLEVRDCPATVVDLGNAIVQNFRNNVAKLVQDIAVVQYYKPTFSASTIRADIQRIAYHNARGNNLATMIELDTLGKHVFQEGYVIASFGGPAHKALLSFPQILVDFRNVATSKLLIAAYGNILAKQYSVHLPQQAYYTINAGLFSSPNSKVQNALKSYMPTTTISATTSGSKGTQFGLYKTSLAKSITDYNTSNQANYSAIASKLIGSTNPYN